MNISGGIAVGDFQRDLQKKYDPTTSSSIHVVFSQVSMKFEPVRVINTERLSCKSTQKDWTLETPRLDPSVYENAVTLDYRRDDIYTSLFVRLLILIEAKIFIGEHSNLFV